MNLDTLLQLFRTAIRRLTINGKLGRVVPARVRSGARVPPSAALLFIIVTEALSRLINADWRIKGVCVDGIHHKLSQYADDTTLIPGSSNDDTLMQAHLQLWCDATGMLENDKKREGILLGWLRRHPDCTQSAPRKESSPTTLGQRMAPPYACLASRWATTSTKRTGGTPNT